jgi:hypothetical protein
VAVFARPAVWSYDLPLFRQAINDEEQLEALLAAIALEDEAVWVAEANQRPVAFAWGRREGASLRLLRFYVSPDAGSPEVAPRLMERIEREGSGQTVELVVAEEIWEGVAATTLPQLGFIRQGTVWTKPLRVLTRPSLT